MAVSKDIFKVYILTFSLHVIQARTICSQKARTDKHRFLVGTCSTKEVNEVGCMCSLLYSPVMVHVFKLSSVMHHACTVVCLGIQ